MRCLGRIPSRRDSRTFQLRRYLGPASKLPGSPPARDWTQPFGAPRWGMYGNNVIGDCAEAACGHLIQAASAVTGRPVCVRLADIETAYAAITGWDPARPETDQGSHQTLKRRSVRTAGFRQHLEAPGAVLQQVGDAELRGHVQNLSDPIAIGHLLQRSLGCGGLAVVGLASLTHLPCLPSPRRPNGSFCLTLEPPSTSGHDRGPRDR